MTIEAHALLLISALVSNWSIGIDGTRRLMGIRKRILTQHLLEDGQHASIQSIDRELGYCAGQSLKWDQFGEISGGKVPEEGISQSDLLMVRSVLVSDGVPAQYRGRTQRQFASPSTTYREPVGSAFGAANSAKSPS
jgi:hypothetical protein